MGEPINSYGRLATMVGDHRETYSGSLLGGADAGASAAAAIADA